MASSKKAKRATSASSASSNPFVDKEEDTTPSKTLNPSPMKKKKKPDAVTQQQQAESEESDSGSGSHHESEDGMPPDTPSASCTSSPEEEDTLLPVIPQPASAKRPDAATQEPQQQQEEEEAKSDESESGSASDDESEEESESEPEPATTLTPVTTTRARSSKTSAAATAGTRIVVAVSATGEKKRAAATERSPAKRVKMIEESGEKSEVKKKLFERRWSEDDEIALLEGFWEFTEKKGIEPSKDMNAFHDFIKKELHFDVKLIQLKDKIWRLKKRFDNNLMNGKKGEDKTFSKPHEQKLFDLSKRIWGNDIRVQKFSERTRSKPLANSKADLGKEATIGEDKDTAIEEEDMVDKMEIVEVTRKNFQGMADYVVKRGLDVVDEDQRAEMEEKWRVLHVKEMEVFLKRIELVEEHAKLALAIYKGQGN